MMNILEMKHIGKKFSGVYANEKIDLSVAKGEIHALLGENGAGKTTLMNILFGIYSADEGEIFWKGKQVHFHSPKDAIAEGIGMVHQHFSLVNKMTVLDNVILGLEKQGFFLDRKSAKKSLEDLAERYGLQVDPDARISDLSVGQQQRVEILKALYRNVELLILDEPTGVLTPKETEKFFSVLRKLKAEGYAVIIITHRMSEIMSISDRVTILRDGKKIKDLVTKDTNPTELSNYMIGRQLDYNFEVKETEKKEIALQLKDITVKKGHKKPVLDQINLEVYKGEILGIAGVDGNGQKELAEVMIAIGSHFGKDVKALISNMNQPLGDAIGNALEVKEAIATLQGKGPEDFTQLCLEAGSIMLMQTGIARDEENARKQLLEVIQNGKALEKLVAMVAAQEGDVEQVLHPELLPQAKEILEVTSREEGYVKELHALELGTLAMKLGAGRMVKEDPVDPAVGIVLNKKDGDYVNKGDILAYVHINHPLPQHWLEDFYQTYVFTQEKVEKQKLIHDIIR